MAWFRRHGPWGPWLPAGAALGVVLTATNVLAPAALGDSTTNGAVDGAVDFVAALADHI